MAYPEFSQTAGIKWPHGLKADSLKTLRNLRRMVRDLDKNDPMPPARAKMSDIRLTLDRVVTRGDSDENITIDVDAWEGDGYHADGYLDVWGWKEADA